MNKEYVLEKLAEEFSAVERGILIPENPVLEGLKNATAGTILGGLGGVFLTTPLKNIYRAKEEGKLFKTLGLKAGIGAALGGVSLGTLAYLISKAENKRKKEDPESYLIDLGKNLRYATRS